MYSMFCLFYVEDRTSTYVGRYVSIRLKSGDSAVVVTPVFVGSLAELVALSVRFRGICSVRCGTAAGKLRTGQDIHVERFCSNTL